MPIREKNMWANQMVGVVEAVRLLSRSAGASINELITELGVERNTVYRLKKTLERLIGTPLDEVDSTVLTDKRWKFPDGFTIKLPLSDKLGLSTPELVALYALRMNAGLFRGSVISEDIESAFVKIGTALSPAAKKMLENYANMFISVPKTPKDFSEHAEIIEELSMAMLERTTCTICYSTFSDKEVTEKRYNIDPLHFFERDGGLYVLAVSSYYKTVRLLAVERIKSIKCTDLQFAWPKDFDPVALLEKSFGLYWDDPLEVEIWFSADQARYIKERQWAQDQKITTRTDGSVVLWMKTSGWYDVKKWILSFGAEARVLEPVHLQDKVRKEVEKMLKGYGEAVQ